MCCVLCVCVCVCVRAHTHACLPESSSDWAEVIRENFVLYRAFCFSLSMLHWDPSNSSISSPETSGCSATTYEHKKEDNKNSTLTKFIVISIKPNTQSHEIEYVTFLFPQYRILSRKFGSEKNST